ncbi:hypothetical protein [Deinococcus ficus]|uniref:tRNA-guanine(15) transglycosylase-like domain-containing protein n=1 Tax=Deinococcus ficus TaxID=317577 RepID=A0A221T2W6_9DEIO|nr:hypothetical protein [Deinococcus ficus]ASN83200.1 hypothetical protein DFI_18545 [Deinococcus ficus]
MTQTSPIQGFVPVLTLRFPLDALLRPYVERLSPAALISVPELQHRRDGTLPDLPLMIDSGGYAALQPGAQVSRRGGLGILTLADGRQITPRDVHAEQERHAHTGFTLDFPCPDQLGAEERARRLDLGLANARWALRQPRRFQLYACVQPGQAAAPFLALEPDGLALGGLAPHSRDRGRIHDAVREVRQQMPAGMPLHVFGIGHPDSLRAVFAAGATSADSSACQRLAADGRSWQGEALSDPAPHERLRFALHNLLAATEAGARP